MELESIQKDCYTQREGQVSIVIQSLLDLLDVVSGFLLKLGVEEVTLGLSVVSIVGNLNPGQTTIDCLQQR